MRYEKQMQEIAYDLEVKHGYNALQCIYGLKRDELTADDIKRSPTQKDRAVRCNLCCGHRRIYRKCHQRGNAVCSKNGKRDHNAFQLFCSKRKMQRMKPEYDFTNAKKNPYAKKLKKQITINIDTDTIDYFKEQSDRSGIPYQTLINLYLADCAKNKKQLQLSWG